MEIENKEEEEELGAELIDFLETGERKSKLIKRLCEYYRDRSNILLTTNNLGEEFVNEFLNEFSDYNSEYNFIKVGYDRRKAVFINTFIHLKNCLLNSKKKISIAYSLRRAPLYKINEYFLKSSPTMNHNYIYCEGCEQDMKPYKKGYLLNPKGHSNVYFISHKIYDEL